MAYAKYVGKSKTLINYPVYFAVIVTPIFWFSFHSFTEPLTSWQFHQLVLQPVGGLTSWCLGQLMPWPVDPLTSWRLDQ